MMGYPVDPLPDKANICPDGWDVLDAGFAIAWVKGPFVVQIDSTATALLHELFEEGNLLGVAIEEDRYPVAIQSDGSKIDLKERDR